MAKKRFVADTFRDAGSQLVQVGTTLTGGNSYTANGANPTNDYTSGVTVTTAGTVLADRIQMDIDDATPLALILDNLKRIELAVMDWYARK